MEIVPNLKINKLEKFGNVLTDSLIEQDNVIELFQFPNVELKYNPCSVCLDQCCTKTKDCKHPLCFLCCSKIKFVCNDMCDGCDNCCTRDCPICRGRFNVKLIYKMKKQNIYNIYVLQSKIFTHVIVSFSA